jgi:hypothetical protein
MPDAKAIPIKGPAASSHPEQPERKDRSFAARWKHDELFAKGFVPVPVHFLELYAQLKPFPLTAGEAMFILHVMQFKWGDEAPFPGYKRIAAQMGISHKMARTHAKSLETKRLLRREMRVAQTNRFDLTPLFDALNKIASGAKKSKPRGIPARADSSPHRERKAAG